MKEGRAQIPPSQLPVYCNECGYLAPLSQWVRERKLEGDGIPNSLGEVGNCCPNCGVWYHVRFMDNTTESLTQKVGAKQKTLEVIIQVGYVDGQPRTSQFARRYLGTRKAQKKLVQRLKVYQNRLNKKWRNHFGITEYKNGKIKRRARKGK